MMTLSDVLLLLVGASLPRQQCRAETKWGSPVEIERRRRIMIAAAAWSYEQHYNPIIMTDEEFDRECLAVDLSMDTGNPKMDKWFRENFTPHTGQWVHKHPEKEGLENIYQNAVRRAGGRRDAQ